MVQRPRAACRLALACPWWVGYPPCLPSPSISAADLLVGRSDSGICWLFDLSERLGWADGSHPGTWLRRAQQGKAAAGAGGAARGGQAGAAAGGVAEQGEADWEMAEGQEAPDEVSMQGRLGSLPIGVVTSAGQAVGSQQVVCSQRR